MKKEGERGTEKGRENQKEDKRSRWEQGKGDREEIQKKEEE